MRLGSRDLLGWRYQIAEPPLVGLWLIREKVCKTRAVIDQELKPNIRANTDNGGSGFVDMEDRCCLESSPVQARIVVKVKPRVLGDPERLHE